MTSSLSENLNIINLIQTTSSISEFASLINKKLPLQEENQTRSKELIKIVIEKCFEFISSSPELEEKKSLLLLHETIINFIFWFIPQKPSSSTSTSTPITYNEATAFSRVRHECRMMLIGNDKMVDLYTKFLLPQCYHQYQQQQDDNDEEEASSRLLLLLSRVSSSLSHFTNGMKEYEVRNSLSSNAAFVTECMKTLKKHVEFLNREIQILLLPSDYDSKDDNQILISSSALRKISCLLDSIRQFSSSLHHISYASSHSTFFVPEGETAGSEVVNEIFAFTFETLNSFSSLSSLKLSFSSSSPTTAIAMIQTGYNSAMKSFANFVENLSSVPKAKKIFCSSQRYADSLLSCLETSTSSIFSLTQATKSSIIIIIKILCYAHGTRSASYSTLPTFFFRSPHFHFLVEDCLLLKNTRSSSSSLDTAMTIDPVYIELVADTLINLVEYNHCFSAVEDKICTLEVMEGLFSLIATFCQEDGKFITSSRNDKNNSDDYVTAIQSCSVLLFKIFEAVFQENDFSSSSNEVRDDDNPNQQFVNDVKGLIESRLVIDTLMDAVYYLDRECRTTNSNTSDDDDEEDEEIDDEIYLKSPYDTSRGEYETLLCIFQLINQLTIEFSPRQALYFAAKDRRPSFLIQKKLLSFSSSSFVDFVKFLTETIQDTEYIFPEIDDADDERTTFYQSKTKSGDSADTIRHVKTALIILEKVSDLSLSVGDDDDEQQKKNLEDAIFSFVDWLNDSSIPEVIMDVVIEKFEDVIFLRLYPKIRPISFLTHHRENNGDCFWNRILAHSQYRAWNNNQESSHAFLRRNIITSNRAILSIVFETMIEFPQGLAKIFRERSDDDDEPTMVSTYFSTLDQLLDFVAAVTKYVNDDDENFALSGRLASVLVRFGFEIVESLSSSTHSKRLLTRRFLSLTGRVRELFHTLNRKSDKYGKCYGMYFGENSEVEKYESLLSSSLKE